MRFLFANNAPIQEYNIYGINGLFLVYAFKEHRDAEVYTELAEVRKRNKHS